MSTTSSYPVRVDADLQPGLSRWLWLVKWLLVIPHDIILVFLWVAFAVLSFVAFLAILVTGRYPRSIFDFNVGVLRWNWRVAYYAYSSLGTDQYPPFTLYERADYPAHLDVAYPERLSRGLALVKWWLLAIPHYLVVGFFLGGSWYLTSAQGARWSAPGGGLILVLVLVAAIVLLFTGRYPQSIFDLVLGLNRWVLRVAAYAALMTDDYPPFRLDMGGADPAVTRLAMPGGGGDPFEGGGPAAAGSAGPAAGGQGATPGPSGGNEWGAGRVVAVVLGSVMFLVGCGLLLAGAGLGIADRALRDSQGYLMSPEASLSTSGSALVSPSVQLQARPASTFPHALLGNAKASIHAAAGQPLFVGVARSDRAAGYLAGVARSTVIELGGSGTTPRYQYHPGGPPARTPERAGIWVASAAGRGPQTISWPVRQGDWTLVVMNRDGSRGVVADVRVGATIPAAGWLVAALLITGAVVAVLAAVVLVAALSRPSPQQPRTAAPAV